MNLTTILTLTTTTTVGLSNIIYPTNFYSERKACTHIIPVEEEQDIIIDNCIDNNIIICYNEEDTNDDINEYIEDDNDSNIANENVNIEDDDFDEENYCIIEHTIEEPFVENELISLTDNEETALSIAEQYGFNLSSYEYGVAVFDTNGQNPKDFLNEDISFSLNHYCDLFQSETTAEINSNETIEDE